MRGRKRDKASAVAVTLKSLKNNFLDTRPSKMADSSLFLTKNKKIQNFTTCSKIFILLIILLSHFQNAESAACKGCTPPCVCPGTKGEKVGIFLIFN